MLLERPESWLWGVPRSLSYFPKARHAQKRPPLPVEILREILSNSSLASSLLCVFLNFRKNCVMGPSCRSFVCLSAKPFSFLNSRLNFDPSHPSSPQKLPRSRLVVLFWNCKNESTLKMFPLSCYLIPSHWADLLDELSFQSNILIAHLKKRKGESL